MKLHDKFYHFKLFKKSVVHTVVLYLFVAAIYLTLVVLICCLEIIATVIVLRLHFSNQSKPISATIDFLVFKCIATILCANFSKEKPRKVCHKFTANNAVVSVNENKMKPQKQIHAENEQAMGNQGRVSKVK
mgnify:CR=1 FL=1